MTTLRLITVIAAIPMLMTGCTHQSQLVLEPTTAPLEITAPIQSNTSSQILFELSVSSQAWHATNQATPIGPQLAVGDWLAWQCALAGRYWDMPLKNAPAYAEALDILQID